MAKPLLLLTLFLFLSLPTRSVATTQERAYIQQVHPYVQQVWDKNVILLADMLLKTTNAFNNKGLVVSLELNILPSGQVHSTGLVASSGYDPFDDTALDAVASMEKLPKPHQGLLSDDGMVHLFWTLKRIRPYSSVALARIRYVRYSTQVAVSRFVLRGLYQKAWRRLLTEAQKEGWRRASLTAYLRALLLKGLGGDRIDPSPLKRLSAYAQSTELPALLFTPYFSLFDQATQKGLLERASRTALCTLLGASLKKGRVAQARRVTLQLLRKGDSCPKTVMERAGKAKDTPLSLLLAGAALRSGTDVDKEKRLIAALGTGEAPWSIRAMGVSGRAVFFPYLVKRIRGNHPKNEKLLAVMALGQLNTKRAGFKLMNLLKNKQFYVALAAADAIPRYRGPEWAKVHKYCTWELGTLIKRSKSAALREAAAKSIVTLTQKSLTDENSKHYFYSTLRNRRLPVLRGAVRALHPAFPPAKKKLEEFLQHKQPELRRIAAHRLELLPMAQRPVSLLAALRSDSDTRLQRLSLAYSSAEKELLSTMRSSTSAVARISAAKRLATLDEPLLRKQIVPLLGQSNRDALFALLVSLSGYYAKAK